MPKISIIIPMYKVERYLRRCLDSVQNQTFTDWQAICVDDGSPDNSGKIAEEYAKQDKRFIVVHKKNGGLSDARNFGMKYAKGKYIMFLDSDDFIHSQTMEIAYGLAIKNKTDIVSWYKNKFYRRQLLIMRKLGFDIDKVRPNGINKTYDINKVKFCVTQNIFNHATEWSHTKIKWPIKHAYVWRHLIKRDLIKNIPFLKGVNFEDFPWWSEVMLQRPTVTITNLPFYYYYPNFGSIDMASNAVKKINHWVSGLEHVYPLYLKFAKKSDFHAWQEQFVVPVLIYQIIRKLKYVSDTDAVALRKRLLKLEAMDAFKCLHIKKYVNILDAFLHGSKN